ncbi:MAG: hypothetical protein PVI57_11445 [Gemmatimonadota bacterium]|jgi:hypothetical protein
MKRISTALGLALALGACTADAPTPLAPERVGSAVAAEDIGTASASSRGAFITMDETIFFFTHFDARRGLMSVHGAIVELCEGLPLSTTPRTIVATPAEVGQRLVKIGERDQPVVVYRTDTGQLTCGLVLSPEARVAAGTVHHDQVFTLASFKATWRGRVTGPDGTPLRLTEAYQLTGDLHDPNNPDFWSLNASEILVHR